jgi:hypothetical protein
VWAYGGCSGQSTALAVAGSSMTNSTQCSELNGSQVWHCNTVAGYTTQVMCWLSGLQNSRCLPAGNGGGLGAEHKRISLYTCMTE